jgi:hypothetical protein
MYQQQHCIAHYCHAHCLQHRFSLYSSKHVRLDTHIGVAAEHHCAVELDCCPRLACYVLLSARHAAQRQHCRARCLWIDTRGWVTQGKGVRSSADSRLVLFSTYVEFSGSAAADSTATVLAWVRWEGYVGALCEALSVAYCAADLRSIF